MQIGDIVQVMDEGLLMLQRFAPKGAVPNNQGVISKIEGNQVDITFPIGQDDPNEHSQTAPYPKHLVCSMPTPHPFLKKVQQAVLKQKKEGRHE